MDVPAQDLFALRTISLFSASSLLEATALRCLPFGAAALLMDDLPLARRSVTLATSGALFSAVVLLEPRPWQTWAGLLVVFGYFTLSTILVWAWSRTRKATRPGPIVAVLLGVAIVLPGLCFSGSARVVALALGFEYFFSLYSYLQEKGAGRTSGDLGDCLLFVMVNPTLVYTSKGSRFEGPVPWAGVAGRFAMGLLVLFLHYFAAAVLPAPWFAEGGSGPGARITIASLVLMWAQLVVWYWSHAGTAGIQVAAMRALGWNVPERYRYPFLARSPEDFWRRWNVYLGQWFYKYVFLPLGITLMRRSESGRGDVAKAVAVLASFAMCGAAHDLNAFMNFRHPGGGATAGFLFGGTVVIVWAWATRAFRRVGKRIGRPWWSWAAGMGSALSPVLLVCLVTLMGWVFLPALRGRSIAEISGR